MDNVQFTKEYINDRIEERGFDEYGQICIDFSNICNKTELLEAVKQLEFTAKKGQGKGVYWIMKK
ncbi:MAG: hypothetical protein ABF633_02595 [Clostridium sp.]|uniref:hypothetical protein n=1 Tax=Clostridium sp. TaxID=1506 RepID=UPI0039EBA101